MANTTYVNLRLTVKEAAAVRDFLLQEPLNNPDMLHLSQSEADALSRFVDKATAAIDAAIDARQ